MSRRPYRPDALALRVFHGTDAVQAGELTPKQLRSSAWTRERVNVYADSRLDDDHALACRCALLALPIGSILAGHSAAYAHGILHAATATDDVHIYGPDGRRLGHRDGIRQHSGMLGPADVTKVGDALCTSAVRTAWDVGRWLPLIGSVPIIDSMLGQDLVNPDQLMRYARERFGQRGSRRSMTAFELTDGRAESRPESQLRVRLVGSGLPRPVAQLPIVLPNGLILHPDLAWEEYRVAVEYDGIWHASAAQLHRDRRRLNLLAQMDGSFFTSRASACAPTSAAWSERSVRRSSREDGGRDHDDGTAVARSARAKRATAVPSCRSWGRRRI